jgi:DNA-binding NarL/FixJ family response regulator
MARRTTPRATPRARTARRGPAAGVPIVRIVIADSQAIDRGGLVGLLEGEADFEVAGEAATVPETIQQCRALKPDVLVLSLNLPGQDQAAAIPTIRAALPALRILALSERGAANCLVLNPPSRTRLSSELKLVCALGTDCLQLAATQGAMATLRRSADPEDLFRAIRAVAQGHAWYDPTTAAGMLTSTGATLSHPDNIALSERELDVAALIVEGQSNKEISTALAISEPTVKKHVGHLLEKLGLQDRLQVGLLLARNPVMFRKS